MRSPYGDGEALRGCSGTPQSFAVLADSRSAGAVHLRAGPVAVVVPVAVTGATDLQGQRLRPGDVGAQVRHRGTTGQRARAGHRDAVGEHGERHRPAAGRTTRSSAPAERSARSRPSTSRVAAATAGTRHAPSPS